MNILLTLTLLLPCCAACASWITRDPDSLSLLRISQYLLLAYSAVYLGASSLFTALRLQNPGSPMLGALTFGVTLGALLLTRRRVLTDPPRELD